MTTSIADLSSLSPTERAKKLQQFAVDQQRQWLTMQYAKDEFFEVRILKNPESKGFLADYYGYFQNTEESIDILIKLLPQYNKAYGIYTTLNSVMPIIKNRSFNKFSKALKNAATQDSEIEQRSWIGIDCDPIRPTGIGSTKEQHDLAIDKAKIIIIDLMQLYKVPAQSIVLADSGNGAHINIKIDQTVNQLPPATVQNMLLFLASKYTDTRIKIDTGVYNNSRIWKLYGTVARKGDHSEETPHRLAYIIDAPERGQMVNCPLSIIQKLASLSPKKESRATNPATKEENKKDNQSKQSNQANTPHNDNNKHSSTTNSSNQYKRAQAYIDKIDGGVQGNNGSGVAYNVACVLVHGFPQLSNLEREQLFSNWNQKCTPPFSDSELEHKLESAEKNGSYPVVEDKPLPNKKSSKKHQSTQKAQGMVNQLPPLNLLIATATKLGLAITDTQMDCPIHPMSNPATIPINIFDHGIGAFTCSGGKDGDGIIHNNIEIMAALGLKHGSLNYKREESKTANNQQSYSDNQPPAPPNQSDGCNSDSPERPIIYVHIHADEQIDQCKDAILLLNNSLPIPELYIKNGKIVIVEQDDKGALKTIEVSEDLMFDFVLRSAIWLRPGKEETEKSSAKPDAPAKPSRDIAKLILAKPDKRLPELYSIVSYPCLVEDQLLTQKGYYPSIKTLYLPSDKLKLPPIKDNPTIEDVEAAKDFLFNNTLVDFCFENKTNSPLTKDSVNANRTNFLAHALITPIVKRNYVGLAPILVMEAATQGEGKTKLVQTSMTIIEGITPPAKTLPTEEVEINKSVTSSFIAGSETIFFDNVTGKLQSDTLSVLTTSLYFEARQLGSNTNRSFRNNMTVVITANNLRIDKDQLRRVLHCRLNSGKAQPYLFDSSKYKHPQIEKWCLDNRGDILAALLVLVNYWRSQGKPLRKQLLGSFEEWSANIGGLLECCGIGGFCDNIEENVAIGNIENEAIYDLIEVWWEKYVDQPTSVKDLNYLCQQNNILEAVRGDKKSGELVRLGSYLTKHRGQVLNGYIIEVSHEVKLPGYRKGSGYKLRKYTPETPNPEPPIVKPPIGEVSGVLSPLESITPNTPNTPNTLYRTYKEEKENNINDHNTHNENNNIIYKNGENYRGVSGVSGVVENKGLINPHHSPIDNNTSGGIEKELDSEVTKKELIARINAKNKRTIEINGVKSTFDNEIADILENLDEFEPIAPISQKEYVESIKAANKRAASKRKTGKLGNGD